jgi:hypothetical protein
MIKKSSVCAIFAAIASMLILAGSASAASPTTEASLSNQSLLGTQTTSFADGSTMTSTVTPDSTAPLALVNGYPCADVGYRAVVKWYTAITNWVSWTWDMHFGVHVCNNQVKYVTHAYASVDSELPTWSYCGVIYKYVPGPNMPTSAWLHMEGCFSLYDKIVVQKFPWAKITIGGNGGLWARSTGVS